MHPLIHRSIRLWFGWEEYLDEDEYGNVFGLIPAQFFFELDFTERYVIREPDRQVKGDDEGES